MSVLLDKVLKKGLVFIMCMALLTETMLVGGIQVSAYATALPVAVKLNSFSTDIVSSGDNANTLLYSKGNTTVASNWIQLTSNTGNQSGTVVRRNKMHLKDGFSTYFRINLSNGSNPPADGLCFTIYGTDSNISSIGCYGGGIGYAGIQNSIGVEFDTFQNTGSDNKTAVIAGVSTPVVINTNDPADKHVAIDTNGNVCHDGSLSSASTSSASPTDDDTQNLAHSYNGMYNADTNVWVDYSSSDGYVTVTYGPDTIRTSSSNYSFKRKVGTALLDKEVYVGFAASTGGSNEYHYVKQWYFDNQYVPDGLDPNANYTQAPSTISVQCSSASHPSAADIKLLDATGAIMTNQNFELYLDGTDKGSFNTGSTGTCTYTIPAGLTPGAHTIKAVAEAGGALNTATFTTTCTVTYAQGDHGSIGSPATEFVEVGGKPANVPSVTPGTGYDFSGWSSNGGTTKYTTAELKNQPINNNVMYTAYYTAKTYPITFDSQGGTAAGSKNVTYDAKVGALPTLTKPGYAFGGWFTDANGQGTKYDENTVYNTDGATTLYAKWTANPYSLSFDSQGGTAAGSKNVTYDAQVGALPGSAKTGYTFGGWFTGVNGTGTQYSANTVYKTGGSTTLHANWTPNIYTISFDSQNGTAQKDQNAVYNVKIGTLKVPTKDGYSFDGWYTNAGTRYDENTVYQTADSMTLHAKWTIDPGNPDTAPAKAVTNTVHSGDTDTATLQNSDINGIGAGNLGITVGNVTLNVPAAIVSGLTADDLSSRLQFTQKPTPKAAVDLITENAALTDSVVTSADLSLKKIYSNGAVTDIHNVAGKVKITLALTDAQAAQIHDLSRTTLFYYDSASGKLEKMDAVFDLTKNTVTFYTSQFSTYLIVTPKADAKAPETTAKTPATGDAGTAVLPAGIAVIAAASVFFISRRKEKEFPVE